MGVIIKYKDSHTGDTWENIYTAISGFRVGIYGYEVMYHAGGHVPISKETYEQIYPIWKQLVEEE